jgi:hypothetical protein
MRNVKKGFVRIRTIEGTRSIDAPSTLITAASVTYIVNCALGSAVAIGAVRTGRWRWTHHALYITTSILTTAAAVALLIRNRPAGLAVLPALVPLAVIPFAGTHGHRHPMLALAAAPFFAASVVQALRRR